MGEVVRCPDCGKDISLKPGVQAGDIVDCPYCAGISIRLDKRDSRWEGRIRQLVSCAVCDETIELHEGIKNGDIIEHCGVPQRVMFEWGAWAAERF